MKLSEWKRVSAPLAERLPEFRRAGRGFFLESEWVAVGLSMDESRQKEQFYLEAFLMPLFVPAETVYFNYGHRLRDRDGRQTWSAFDGDLVSLTVDALRDLRTPDPLARLRNMIERQPVTVATLETLLCISLLSNSSRGYREYARMAHDWVVPDELTGAYLERCRRVTRLVDLGGREAALVLFADRRESVRELLD